MNADQKMLDSLMQEMANVLNDSEDLGYSDWWGQVYDWEAQIASYLHIGNCPATDPHADK